MNSSFQATKRSSCRRKFKNPLQQTISPTQPVLTTGKILFNLPVKKKKKEEEKNSNSRALNSQSRQQLDIELTSLSTELWWLVMKVIDFIHTYRCFTTGNPTLFLLSGLQINHFLLSGRQTNHFFFHNRQLNTNVLD